MNTQPFDVIRHSTDSAGLPIVDVRGTYLSNSDSIKLRDELNRLLTDPDRDRLKQERDEVVKALRDLVGRIDFAAKEDDKSEEPETIRTFSMASAFMDHARTVLKKLWK